MPVDSIQQVDFCKNVPGGCLVSQVCFPAIDCEDLRDRTIRTMHGRESPADRFAVLP